MQPVAEAIPSVSIAVGSTPMKALLQSAYGSTDVFRVGSTSRPKPAAGEVLVNVRAAGIDRGTWHLMTGRPYLMRLMGFGFRAPKNPVPGLDLVGTVVELGADVTRFSVGDTVFGYGRGSFAEFACAREDKLELAPAKLSAEQAAVLAVSGSTALQALDGVKAGDRALIIGASGGVGSFAVQLARALGAHVTAVCSTKKIEAVRAFGANEVIDYRSTDFTAIEQRFDVILDCGGNTPLGKLRKLMTPTGRLVFVGGENGGDWTAGFGRQLAAAVLGLFVKQKFVMLVTREHSSSLERLARFVNAGQLTPHIDRVIDLTQVPAALRDLEEGRVCGKIAVTLA